MKVQSPTSWQAILRLLLDCHGQGSPQGKALAVSELSRMAEAADQWNQHVEQTKADEKRSREEGG